MQTKRNREKLKELASVTSSGIQRSVMFLGMLVAFAGSLVAFIAGAYVSAVLLLALALFVGAALVKLEWE
jgi:Flp pilus assembly protein TadB